MTEEELQAIEKACAQATPQPWEPRLYQGRLTHIVGPGAFPEQDVEEDERKEIITTDSGCYGPGPEDATFILGARQWVPDLVAEVRRLRAITPMSAASVSAALSRLSGIKPGTGLGEAVHGLVDEVLRYRTMEMIAADTSAVVLQESPWAKSAPWAPSRNQQVHPTPEAMDRLDRAVLKHEIERLQAALLEEREACANIANLEADAWGESISPAFEAAASIAAAIRARKP